VKNNNQIQTRIDHMRQFAHQILQEADELERVFNHQPEPEEWISTQEAADICGIDRSTLNRYALTGKVEARKLGKLWKFPKSRVEDMSFLKMNAS
jgi:excisionase family DNA binding protein